MADQRLPQSFARQYETEMGLTILLGTPVLEIEYLSTAFYDGMGDLIVMNITDVVNDEEYFMTSGLIDFIVTDGEGSASATLRTPFDPWVPHIPMVLVSSQFTPTSFDVIYGRASLSDYDTMNFHSTYPPAGSIGGMVLSYAGLRDNTRPDDACGQGIISILPVNPDQAEGCSWAKLTISGLPTLENFSKTFTSFASPTDYTAKFMFPINPEIYGIDVDGYAKLEVDCNGVQEQVDVRITHKGDSGFAKALMINGSDPYEATPAEDDKENVWSSEHSSSDEEETILARM